MNVFFGYVFLGFVITQITEIIKKLIQNRKEKGLIIPLILGILISFGCKLSLCSLTLSILQLNIGMNWLIDRIITGLLLSQGANGVYEIIDFVGTIKENIKKGS